MCEFVNRFPADRRKVEVSLFSVDFETGHVGGQVVIRKKVLLAQSISSPTVMCALD